MSSKIERPKAYKGDESYIFISYSHKDSVEVYEIIHAMQTMGYRVWYDEGIRSGKVWDKEIIKKIKGCACFVAFITEDYMRSRNCSNEISFANRKDKEKNIAIIYLKEILDEDVNDLIDFRFGQIQGLYKYKYVGREELFFESLYETEGMDKCLNEWDFEKYYDPMQDSENWKFMEEEEEYEDYDIMDYELHIFPEIRGIEEDMTIPAPNPVAIGWDSTEQVIEWCGEMAEVSVRDGDVWEKDIEECVAYMKLARFHNKNLPAGHRFRIVSTFVDRNSPCNAVHIEYWYDNHMEPLFDEEDVRHIFYDNWEFVDGIIYNTFVYIGSEDMHLGCYLDKKN